MKYYEANKYTEKKKKLSGENGYSILYPNHVKE